MCVTCVYVFREGTGVCTVCVSDDVLYVLECVSGNCVYDPLCLHRTIQGNVFT